MCLTSAWKKLGLMNMFGVGLRFVEAVQEQIELARVKLGDLDIAPLSN